MKEEIMQKWLADNLPLLKALKRPSEDQRDLIQLADMEERSPEETKFLGALVAAEKAMQSAKAKRKAIADIKNAEARAAKKLADGQKIVIGGFMMNVLKDNEKLRDWFLREAPKKITRENDDKRLQPFYAELAKLDSSA